jgi:hypothetical protein
MKTIVKYEQIKWNPDKFMPNQGHKHIQYGMMQIFLNK